MSSLPTTTLRRRSREAYTPPPRTLAQTAARNLQLNVLGLIGIAVGLVVLLSNLPAHVGHGSSKQPAELHHVKRALDPMAAQRAKSALVGAFVADAATSGARAAAAAAQEDNPAPLSRASASAAPASALAAVRPPALARYPQASTGCTTRAPC